MTEDRARPYWETRPDPNSDYPERRGLPDPDIIEYVCPLTRVEAQFLCMAASLARTTYSVDGNKQLRETFDSVTVKLERIASK